MCGNANGHTARSHSGASRLEGQVSRWDSAASRVGGLPDRRTRNRSRHDKQTSAHRVLCRIMTTTLHVGRFRGICRGISLRKGLFPLMVAYITIHVEPAEGTLERIDHSVMVLVEFLKVVVQDLTRPGVRRSPCSAIPAGVVALRLLEYSIIREVRLRLDDGRRTPFLPRLLMAADLPGSPIGRRLPLRRCGHGPARFSPSRLLGTYFW